MGPKTIPKTGGKSHAKLFAGFSDGVDGRDAVRPAEDRVARHEGIGAVRDDDRGRFGVDTAIDLNSSPPDSNGDSLIDQYLDANNINNDDSPPYTSPHWRQVIAAKVWLLTRAECGETGLVNNRTYDDLGDVDYAVNDDFRRQLYQTTVFLRNLNVTER